MVRHARRSSRVALSIPVEVVGIDASGTEVHEKASTKIVSRHGAYLFLHRRLFVGSDVTVRVPHLNLEQKCRVIWVGSTFGEQGPYETGIEMDAAENLWGVRFPPEDWVMPRQLPLAGDRPGPLLPQTISGDPEQQVMTIGAMLNVLIALLEEKGIVTRSELADKLKELI
jgi:PilZ domain-containing protein